MDLRRQKLLKIDPDLAHIPIIMVTALSAQEDKVKGLECGADDFLTKPINDKALMTRLKSLVRLKMMLDELRLRDKTSVNFGIENDESMERRNQIQGRNVLIIDDDAVQIEKDINKLNSAGINADSTSDPNDAIVKSQSKDYSLVIVSTQMVDHDGLRIFSQMRAQDHLRNTPFLIAVDENDEMTLTRGLELGVNDYLVAPIELNELLARSMTQIKRKNFQDELKESFLNAVS